MQPHQLIVIPYNLVTAVDDVTAEMDVEKNETEDQIAECEMEIEDNSPDVIEQPMEQGVEKTDGTAYIDNESQKPPVETIPTSDTSVELATDKIPTSIELATDKVPSNDTNVELATDKVPTSDTNVEPATDKVQSSKDQHDIKQPLPPGNELETTPLTINNTIDTATLSESVQTVESEKESDAPVELQEVPTHPDEENPPLPPPEPKPDDHPLPPGTSDEDVIPPPPGTETVPGEGEPLSLRETAIPVDADILQVPPESELKASVPKTASEAPQSIATLSTSSTVAQEESSTVSVATASSYFYTPVSQAAAAYYQAGSGGNSTVPSGTYDYAAYAQSLAAQQQQAYNYAYATNNYSGYMQAYNAYLQQASAAASYGAYSGQYYPSTYAYPGTSYANQYSAGAAYYGTGNASTGAYNTASYQTTSSYQPKSQQVQVQTTQQQQVQVSFVVGLVNRCV